jgi:hypothetical protein
MTFRRATPSAELSSCFIGAAITAFRVAPQFPQNFAVGAFSNPQEAHRTIKSAASFVAKL